MTPSSGTGAPSSKPHGAQHRAVAAEADDEVGLGQRSLADEVAEAERGGVVVGTSQASWPCSVSQSIGLARERRGLGALVVGDDGDARSCATSCPVHGRGRGTRGCPRRRGSASPSTPTTEQPAATSAAATSARTRSWIGGIGDDARAHGSTSARPASNCGLTSSTIGGTRLAQRHQRRDDHGRAR